MMNIFKLLNLFFKPKEVPIAPSTPKEVTMTLKLHRTDFTHDGIFGTLSDDNGSYHSTTLEHAYDSGQGDGSYAPKLPNGEYTCIRGTHQLHNSPKFETFEVTNVPGHTGILFHVGNYNADSEGCILLGTDKVMSLSTPMISHSKVAFASFLQLTKDLNQFTLIVT